MSRLLIMAMLFFSLTSLSMHQLTAVVIGAGPAGLAAAQRLQSHGFSVKILEKNNRVGGKCLTVPCKLGKGDVELGAIQVGIGYPKVNYYRKQLGIKLRNYWPSRALRFNEDKLPIYRSLAQEYWPIADAQVIMQESLTMSKALARFSDFNNHHFTNMPSDSEFVKPFSEWADDLQLFHFKEDFRIWMTSYGYGLLDDVPAYLALSLINSSVGLVFMRRFDMNLRMLDGGYGGLLNAMVKHYHLDVQLGTTIVNINRNPDNVVVTYLDGNQTQVTQRFDHLVLACGIGCLKDLFTEKQRTVAENALLESVHYSPYDVVIAHVPALEKGGYVLPQFLHAPGHVSLISKNSSHGDDVILYIPRAGEKDEHGRVMRPRRSELAQVVIDDMARFGFADVEIQQIQFWDNYFEHWKDPKFNRLLESIQGNNRTTYAGAAARFEIVERAMQHAHDTVDQHILHLPLVPTSHFEDAYDLGTAFYDYLMADYRDG